MMISGVQTVWARTYSTSLKNIAQQILLLSDQEDVLTDKVKQLKSERKEFQNNPPKHYQELVQLRNQLKIRAEMTVMLVDELSQSLNNAQQRGNKLLNVQRSLQVRLLSEQAEKEKKALTRQSQRVDELIRLNQKGVDLLSTNLALAEELGFMYQQYLDDSLLQMEAMEKKQVIQGLRRQVRKEQKKIDVWLMKMSALNQQKDALLNISDAKKQMSKQILQESYLFYYTQQVQFSNLKITLLESAIRQNKMAETFKNLQQEPNNSTKLTAFQNTLANQINTLQEVSDAIKQRQELIKKQEKLIQNALQQQWISAQNTVVLKQELSQLKNCIVQLILFLKKQDKAVVDMQGALQDYFTQMVAKRQALLKSNEALAAGFFHQLMGLPKLLGLYLSGLWEQTWQGLVSAKAVLHLFVSGALMLLSIFIWWLGRKYFQFLSVKFLKNRHRTAANIVYVFSELFYRNCGSLCLFLYGWFILNFAGISFDVYVGLFYTVLIWFGFRVIMGIARISLVERESDTQGHDARLYHRLKWVFIVGGWATVLVVLSHQFDIGGVIAEISNRLFMAFLLTVSVVLIRARHVLPGLVDPIFVHRKYLSRTVRTVCWLLPFCFFISTALGLLGYINLAWILIYYQAALILVVACYMILRGLVTDLLDISSEWMIRRLNQGWLWTEAFLKPLDKLLHIFLFLCMVSSIFMLLGWQRNAFVVGTIENFFNYSFFSFSGIEVTPLNIIEFFALVCFFVWLAKWTREFAYRWLFRNSKDIGIRNSLAVLSQYIIVTFGGIVTLRVLGVDMTGISVILGGLAVGLGFGLRDFANNIVGGLMLLIERSVKEGDIVSIGQYEGEVTHIGIRAMQIRSWDHMEVMVPNSEIFMRPFMNWTHQDSVVRTVIPMKIHPVDDPVLVQKMILDLLHNVSEVLPEPAPEVYFVNAGALIEFEIRYFINIETQTRAAIRSKIILIIINALKKAGIRSPNIQQDSYVWEMDSSLNKL